MDKAVMPLDQRAEGRPVALLRLADQLAVGGFGFVQHHRRHLRVGRKLWGNPWGEGRKFFAPTG
jgi:hypothetical protein